MYTTSLEKYVRFAISYMFICIDLFIYMKYTSSFFSNKQLIWTCNQLTVSINSQSLHKKENFHNNSRSLINDCIDLSWPESLWFEQQ